MRLHEIIETQTKTYLLTDYCSEGDLTKFIHRYRKDSKKFDDMDTKYVTKEVLKGLLYLADREIMHRDLKMDNILVHRKNGTDGTNKVQNFEFVLGDLGLAKKVADLRQT